MSNDLKIFCQIIRTIAINTLQFTLIGAISLSFLISYSSLNAQEYPINSSLSVKYYELDYRKEYVYCTNTNPNVYKIKITTGETVQTNILSPYPPVFAKHANYAVYLSADRMSLRFYNPENGTDSLLLNLPGNPPAKNTEACRLSFSPSGRYLLVHHNDTSRVYDFQTKQLQNMRGEYSMNEFSPFCWSDEETKIFYFAITRNYQHILKKMDILSSTVEELLTTDTTTLNSDRRSYFAYNQTRKILAYGITTRPKGDQELHFYNVLTRKDTIVLKTKNYPYSLQGYFSELVWSPDNNSIAFKTSDYSTHFNFHIYRVNGTGVSSAYDGIGRAGSSLLSNINWMNNNTISYVYYGVLFGFQTVGFTSIVASGQLAERKDYTEIKVFPNPSKVFPNVILKIKAKCEYRFTVTDILGRIINEGQGEVSGPQSVDLCTPGEIVKLSSGIYCCNVIIAEANRELEKKSIPFIIQR